MICDYCSSMRSIFVIHVDIWIYFLDFCGMDFYLHYYLWFLLNVGLFIFIDNKFCNEYHSMLWYVLNFLMIFVFDGWCTLQWRNSTYTEAGWSCVSSFVSNFLCFGRAGVCCTVLLVGKFWSIMLRENKRRREKGASWGQLSLCSRMMPILHVFWS